jgi:hypothetical protein
MQTRQRAVHALNIRANLSKAGQDDAEEHEDVATQRRSVARGRVGSVKLSFSVAVRAPSIVMLRSPRFDSI